MVKHVVTFRLSGEPEQKRAIAERFCAALNELPAVIPQLISIESGVNINPDEIWDVVLIASLERLEDVAAYSVHPAHVAAASIIAPVKLERACVDFIV